MYYENEKPCCLKMIFGIVIVLAALVGLITIISRMGNARLEEELDEVDSDIKECGC